METTTYAIYTRNRDAFGCEYHSVYNTGLTLERARQDAREAASWGDNGTTFIVVKQTTQIEILDGPENRFEAMPRAGRNGPVAIADRDDWDD